MNMHQSSSNKTNKIHKSSYEKLLELARVKRLGHFYLLRYPSYREDNKAKEKFITNFLVPQLPQQQNFYNNPDLLFLEPKADKDYALSDFVPFFDFLIKAPFYLDNTMGRYIVVEAAHKIPPLISNKLLKSLESPPKNMTIFFLTKEESIFLPTIQGRAQTMLMEVKEEERSSSSSFLNPAKKSSDKNSLENYFKLSTSQGDNLLHCPLDHDQQDKLFEYCKSYDHHHLIDYIEAIKSSPSSQDWTLNFVVNFVKLHPLSYQLHVKIIEELKWWQEAKSFHQNPKERLFALFQILKNYRTKPKI